MENVFPLAVAFLLSAVLSRAILALHQEGWWLLRPPRQDRWHRRETPTLGGVGIFVAFLLTVSLFGELSGNTVKVVAGGALIFGLGLLDDLRPLPAHFKLVGQIAIACLMIALGAHAGFPGSPLLYIPLTILWIVGITNAFNLLDNMDGLAGGVGMIAAFFFGLLTVISSGQVAPPVVAVFVGAIAGFLLFNVHPARIFMGDCGAQFIGFTLAAFTLIDTWYSASGLFLTMATPLLVLAVPIFDTALVTLNRKVHGRPISQGGRDHTSHRLVALGMPEEKTVWVLWGLAVLFGLTALLAHLYAFEVWGLVISAVVIFALVFGVFLTDAKVYEQAAPRRKPRKWLPDVDLFYRRRLLDIAIDTFLIAASFVLAYLLRFDWELGRFHTEQIARVLPLVVPVKLLAFVAFGLYAGLWTYIDFESFRRLFRLSLIASAATVLAVLGAFRFEGFSRTLFAIDFGVLLAFMGGTRALLRAMRESLFAFPESGVRLLVVGAGEAGRQLLAEIRKNRQWNLRPVAIVDDDRRKQRKRLLGIPIVGDRSHIPRVVKEKNVDRIVIAIPSAAEADRLEIQERCRETGLPFTSMPSVEESIIQKLTA